MKKIIDYIVISGDGYNQFVNSVHQMITHGWCPQGGVAINFNKNGREYLQAMVKYEEEPTTKI